MSAPELLMPAGSFEKMQYAFAYGADAVYLGIPKYSLRARENGFIKESVADAVAYAHKHGKKVYVTANVIPHNHKVEPFIKYVGQLLETCRPDAWIMSDPGLIMLMRENFPDQEIHLSVQANTVNYASAKFWQALGVRRIILSRELSIAEIRAIRQACPGLEIEVFVHGSICIAYSGRCLISNYMSSRDPNQGTCSHSCRWEYKIFKKEEEKVSAATGGAEAVNQHGEPYRYLRDDYYLEETERPGEFMQIDEDENGTYLMNARDLCAIEYLKQLKEAGVDSFKVEGRSKSLFYVAMIARAYRNAIDDVEAGRPLNKANLADIFATSNRGLIAGFLQGSPGRSAEKFDSALPEKRCYNFAGVCRGYDESAGMVVVEPKNPIYNGMQLELVTPTGNRPFTVENLQNEKGVSVNEMHGGPQKPCRMACSEDPGNFALLREKTDPGFDPETIQLSQL